MSIGLDLAVMTMLEKKLAELRQPVEQQTLEGLPAATVTTTYPFNCGYLKALRDVQAEMAEVRQRLME